MQHDSKQTGLHWNAPLAVGVKPTARAMHSATLIVENKRDETVPQGSNRQLLYVFGGWAGGNIFLNDMFAFDIDRLKWSKVRAGWPSLTAVPVWDHLWPRRATNFHLV